MTIEEYNSRLDCAAARYNLLNSIVCAAVSRNDLQAYSTWIFRLLDAYADYMRYALPVYGSMGRGLPQQHIFA